MNYIFFQFSLLDLLIDKENQNKYLDVVKYEPVDCPVQLPDGRSVKNYFSENNGVKTEITDKEITEQQTLSNVIFSGNKHK